MKSDQEKIWYPLIGKNLVLEHAHIYYKGKLLCNKAINVAISDAKANGGKLLLGCLRDTQMCKKCEEIYKTDDRFPYKKWTGG